MTPQEFEHFALIMDNEGLYIQGDIFIMVKGIIDTFVQRQTIYKNDTGMLESSYYRATSFFELLVEYHRQRDAMVDFALKNRMVPEANNQYFMVYINVLRPGQPHVNIETYNKTVSQQEVDEYTSTNTFDRMKVFSKFYFKTEKEMLNFLLTFRLLYKGDSIFTYLKKY